ncbi:MAG: CHAT domain-containing protein [Acidimicrobiales bacterium]
MTAAPDEAADLGRCDYLRVESAQAESPATLARRAIDLAASDAAAAVEVSERALELTGGRDASTAAIAWRALGLVALYANDLPLAGRRLAQAIDVAHANGLTQLEGEARMSLAPVLWLTGEGDAALAECDGAAALLDGLPRARLEVQRAGLLEDLDRRDEALRAYARALPVLRGAGERLWEARAHHNRAHLYLVAGDLTRARHDLLAADRMFAELGSDRLRAQGCHHLGRLEALAGDLPAALGWFAMADELNARVGVRDLVGLTDRCAALVPARLGEEAKAAAEMAIAESERAGEEHYLAQARMAHAEACLLTGDPATAVQSAELAAVSFHRRRLRRWAALAGFVAVRARRLGGERSNRLLTSARASAAELDRAEWTDAAAEARLLAGQVAIELGRPAVARPELEGAARLRGASPAPVRIRAWHAVALLRLLDGDRRGARSALRTGLRIVDAHRATLGATELRARAGGHGTELANLGLRLALADGSATDVLTWSERFRAGALQVAPVSPGRDPAVLRDLGELRRLAGEIEAAALAGDDIAPLRRRQVALEAAVNRLVRTVRGRSAALSRTLSVGDLAAVLGERVMVEMVDVDGSLHGVVVGDHGRRRVALVELGPMSSVRADLDGARFALRRLAFGRRSAASLNAARVALLESARRLDDRLLGSIGPLVGDRPLVVVPTGILHVLPWSVLPSLSGRPVSTVPSAAMWLDSERAADRRSRRRRVVLVAGPRLPGAGPEVAGLARRYRSRSPAGDVVRLTGRNATAGSVKHALDGAALAHVAAHGRFRADNPLFSALELADGPLTVHDLESLRRAPEVIVLSACDSGLSSVHPGDELLGLAAGLLGLGTRTLVASLLPVPDEATRLLMLDFHGRLQAGARPAHALAAAQAAWFAAGDDAALAAAASFVCIGRG